MVQVYTGLIYQGPGLIKTINQGLISYMDKHGCRSLGDAVVAWSGERKVA